MCVGLCGGVRTRMKYVAYNIERWGREGVSTSLYIQFNTYINMYRVSEIFYSSAY